MKNEWDMHGVRDALKEAYKSLEPYGNKHLHDFDRYAFSIETLMSLKDIKSKRVLDLGTGVGVLPLALKKLGVNAEGADHNIFPNFQDDRFAINDIEKLQSIWKKAGLVVHDVDLSLNKASSIGYVDVILSEATIEHLKDPKKFFSMCRDLLSDNGYLLVSTPNVATLIKRLRFLFGKTPYWPIESFFEEGEYFTGHWREYTMDELAYMAEKSGFRVIECHTRNMLSKFKPGLYIRKNFRALLRLLSTPVTGMREIHYILVQKI